MHNLHENKNDQIRYRKMNMQQRVLQYQHHISKQQMVSIQVPPNRRSEIEQFLKLFGYSSEKTRLQVHLIGFFRKKNLIKEKLNKNKISKEIWRNLLYSSWENA
jgi:hypothetical protein